ncbi:hypothetical protein HZH66_006502 [Vespula vulgaris]|uniref:Uncharacterized protein n=1 Tax=Vespula vulgaris TaxID=7454 RepID=A0A834K2C9_VESVU|nr:hypothetical protein HZH66_006502 [Vespula vulgaris]
MISVNESTGAPVIGTKNKTLSLVCLEGAGKLKVEKGKRSRGCSGAKGSWRREEEEEEEEAEEEAEEEEEEEKDEEEEGEEKEEEEERGGGGEGGGRKEKGQR